MSSEYQCAQYESTASNPARKERTQNSTINGHTLVQRTVAIGIFLLPANRRNSRQFHKFEQFIFEFRITFCDVNRDSSLRSVYFLSFDHDDAKRTAVPHSSQHARGQRICEATKHGTPENCERAQYESTARKAAKTKNNRPRRAYPGVSPPICGKKRPSRSSRPGPAAGSGAVAIQL